MVGVKGFVRVLAVFGSVFSVFSLPVAAGGSFDLFGLFVEDVFGSIFLAGVALTLGLYLIGWRCRMSPVMVNFVTLLYVCSFLLVVMAWPLFGILMFFSCFTFFAYQVFMYLSGR